MRWDLISLWWNELTSLTSYLSSSDHHSSTVFPPSAHHFSIVFLHQHHISNVFPPPPPHFYCFPSPTPQFSCFSSSTTTFLLFFSTNTATEFYCIPSLPLIVCFYCFLSTSAFTTTATTTKLARYWKLRSILP